MTDGAIEKLWVELSADSRALLRQIDTAVDGASRRFGKMTTALGNEVAKWGKIAAVGLAAVGVASVKVAADFERVMSETVGLTTLTRDELKGVEQQLLGMAPAMGKSPKEMAEAFYYAVSALGDTDKALAAVEVSAKASAAGLGETSVVVDAVTSAMNAYQMSGDQAAHVTDILVSTVKAGKMPAADLAGALGRVLPVAAQLNVPLEEIGANVATLTRVGLSTDEAVTSLRATMMALISPTKEASDLMDAMGMSAEELRRQAGEEGLLAVLSRMMDATGGNIDLISTLIPNVRALTGVLGSAGTQGETYAGILRDIQSEMGIAEEAFAEAQSTFSFQWKQMLATAQVVAIEIGNVLMPMISRAIDDLRPKLEELAGWLQAELPSAVARAEEAARTFADGLKTIYDWLVALNEYIPVLAATVAILAAAWMWAHPGGAVLVGLGLLATAIGALKAPTEELQGPLLELKRLILEVEHGFLEMILNISTLGVRKIPGLEGWVDSQIEKFDTFTGDVSRRVTEIEAELDRIDDRKIGLDTRSAIDSLEGLRQKAQETGGVIGSIMAGAAQALETTARQAGMLTPSDELKLYGEYLEDVEQRVGPMSQELRRLGVDMSSAAAGTDVAAEATSAYSAALGGDGAGGGGAAESIEKVEERVLSLGEVMLNLARITGYTGGAASRFGPILDMATAAADRLNLSGEQLIEVFQASGESFSAFAEKLAASEWLDRLGKQVDDAMDKLDALQSAFSALYGQPTTEEAESALRLAQLKYERAELVASGKSEKSRAIRKIDEEIEAIEQETELRRLHQDVMRAEMELADQRLITDQAQDDMAWTLIDAFGQVSAQAVPLRDQLFLATVALAEWTDQVNSWVSAAGAIPSFQQGGVMPHTGLAWVHEGEQIGQGGGNNYNYGTQVFQVTGARVSDLWDPANRSLVSR